MVAKPLYKRVLLKISGEALLGDREYGLDPDMVNRVASELASVVAMGVQVCVVIGGGNIFRGVAGASKGMDRVTADYIGMLATIINALALQSALEQKQIVSRVLSAIPMEMVCETYIKRRAVHHLEDGDVVIFAAGTGNPYFTTDTPAALRASEMGCDAIIKATKVDGVYTADPRKDQSAQKFERMSYLDVLTRNLKIMDATAISLARENHIPIIVFSINTPGGFSQVVQGLGDFTVIAEENIENDRFRAVGS